MSAPAVRARWWLVALAAFLATVAIRFSGVLSAPELAAGDLYARLLQHEVGSDIAIVGIDAQSLDELNEWPWPRGTHARVLDRLLQSKPERLFIDIDFSSSSDPHQDELLAQAMSRWPRNQLVLASFLQVASGSPDDVLLTQPLAQLSQHATLGSVNLRPDKDALVRDIQTRWEVPGQTLLSVFALLAHRVAEPEKVTVDYSISPSSFSYYSYTDVLNGRVPIQEFAGKTVMIGATATQLGDFQPVPVYRSLPGVVVEALAAQTLISGAVHAPSQAQYLTLLALWSLLVAAVLSRGLWQANLVLVLSGIGMAVAGTLWARSQLLSLELMPFITVLGAAFLLVTFRSLSSETLKALRFAKLANDRDALMRSIVGSSNECILCVSRDGRVLSANSAAQRLYAAQEGQLETTTLDSLVPGLLAGTSQDRLGAAAGNITEHTAQCLDGTRVPIEVLISPVDPPKRELYTVIVRDLTERLAQENMLRHQATHDSLTGIPNRHWLGTHLAEALRKQQPDDLFALLVMDLTRFKEVNDTLGHVAGDLVLCEVTARFQAVLGTRGRLARIGGDEFAILYSATRQEGELEALALQLGEALRVPIKADDMALEVGVNIGIARYPIDADDGDTLLKRADVAMYTAKRSGDLFAFYSASQDLNSIRRLEMLSELRAAIGTPDLELYYQPKVNLRTGRAESAEALLRWKHPRYGPISPAEFIPMVEATDLLRPLTEWTIAEALRQSRRWRAVGQEICIAVNLSARLLQDGALPGRLAQLLATHPGYPPGLELEITETAMMLDAARALAVVKEIQDLGILVSIDDYGTGYSSLAYLRDLKVHALKLDRSFVSDLETNADNRVIAESTVALAHALNLQVIAEGVETQQQSEFLTAAGFDCGQGYFYSKALPAPQCTAWLEQRNRVEPEASRADPYLQYISGPTA